MDTCGATAANSSRRTSVSRAELNGWEQANILRAAEWVERSRAEPLDEGTIRGLHRRMFDGTWKWAGRYRTSDKNIRAYWAEIPGAGSQLRRGWALLAS